MYLWQIFTHNEGVRFNYTLFDLHKVHSLYLSCTFGFVVVTASFVIATDTPTHNTQPLSLIRGEANFLSICGFFYQILLIFFYGLHTAPMESCFSKIKFSNNKQKFSFSVLFLMFLFPFTPNISFRMNLPATRLLWPVIWLQWSV